MYVTPAAQADKWRALTDTQGYRRRMNAKRHNRGVQVYPGIMSDDADFLSFTSKLATELSDGIAVTVGEDGTLGEQAVPGDFYQLLTVAGYGMNPISVPPVNNEFIRSELKLATGFITPRDRQIFDQLVKFMFARSAPASLGIRREASTGAPDYVNDVIKKKTELRAAFADMERFLDLIDKNKFLELYVDFNSPIVHTTGERTQADKVSFVDGVARSKDREVNDELAARTAMKEGIRRPADKRVFKSGSQVNGHFAGRRRTVFGTSFVPNYVLATFCSSWRKVYLEDFAFTWKHRTEEEILGKMNRFSNIVGFDVKQFDQSVATWMIDAFTEELANYVDPRVAKLVSLMFKAPYIVPYPWVAGTSEAEFNPLYGDDPFDIATFAMEVGLPSGIAINPDSGKLFMVWQYLVVLDRFYQNVLEIGIDTILRGEHDQYAMLNMGDDCVLLLNDSAFGQWFKDGGYTDPYFFLEEERPISFLGNVPYRNERGELKLAPNVVSYLVNWLVPEVGIEHARRRNFWAIGERERRVHYAQAPSYPLVHEAFERHFRDTFGVLPASITAEAYEQQRRYQNLSTWDALVLQNPDYLHYKVSEDAISPEILDLIVTSLAIDETWPVVSKYTDKRFQSN